MREKEGKGGKRWEASTSPGPGTGDSETVG